MAYRSPQPPGSTFTLLTTARTGELQILLEPLLCSWESPGCSWPLLANGVYLQGPNSLTWYPPAQSPRPSCPQISATVLASGISSQQGARGASLPTATGATFTVTYGQPVDHTVKLCSLRKLFLPQPPPRTLGPDPQEQGPHTARVPGGCRGHLFVVTYPESMRGLWKKVCFSSQEVNIESS